MFNPAIVGKRNVETLTGNTTLTIQDINQYPIQVLDPGGSSRDLVLPSVDDSRARSVTIINASDNSEVITIKDADGNTICTPTEDEAAICFCDGEGNAWYGIVGSTA